MVSLPVQRPTAWGKLGSFLFAAWQSTLLWGWEWWGHPGPFGQAFCSVSLALTQDTSSGPTGASSSCSPPQGLGFWLVRGPVWGQLCGPRQRGPAACLLKEEKQQADY